MNIENIADKIDYKVIKTKCMDSESITDFLKIQNNVFNENFTLEKFSLKYLENPFGSSFIVLCYYKNECIASRAFWRNDLYIDNEYVESYQPCDTAVMESYRGKSLFSKMTKIVMKKLDAKAKIYSFPNDYSLRAYNKMNWRLIASKRYLLFNQKNHSKQINLIEDIYFEWISKLVNSKKNKKLYYTKKKNEFYLLKKHTYNLYVVIGKISSIENINIPKAILPICLTLDSEGNFGRGLRVVSYNVLDDNNIPLYKLDTIF
ncbi:hypothetical protein BN1048_00967 [Jeotgalicoccus saudimassiliensis]|uniref:Uncharacterized protein n=1 Tax=Jeotgalicoccus saudimassiliensis TaxID=1461582 RepID=A0A078M6Y9_9STAP|nr:GNAT family N-acetyltransferase [Jeotgalicoccus saudimassiliensis]CEA00461.1 hypothetical protein BN1048_00967 [Jeotgalicoccus saudimassiliensis]